MKNINNMEIGVNKMVKAVILTVIGIVFISFLSLNFLQKDKVYDEKFVYVHSVPNGGTITVVYEDELYDIMLPVHGWTKKQSEYAKTLVDNGVIQITEYKVLKDEKQIYPTNVYVDGENVVALLEEQELELFGVNK